MLATLLVQVRVGQVAVVMASERSEEDVLLEGARLLLAGDIDAAAATLAAHARPHAPADRVASVLGTSGPVLQLGNRSAGGLSAIIEAAEMIRRGDALVAVAGGLLQAAHARQETRGAHSREDFPDQRPDQLHRYVVGLAPTAALKEINS